MKKLFLFLLAALPVFVNAANELPDRMPPYVVRYEEGSFQKDSGMVTIECGLFSYQQVLQSFQYGINGSSETVMVGPKDEVNLPLAPKKYTFDFYYNSNYLEIFTDSIEVKPGMRTVISLYFEPVDRPINVKKPVIYLYPETTSEVTVSVQPVGELTFTYPAYNNGWQVTAQSNGDLSVNGKTYPYLFWESEQPQMEPFRDGKATVVSRENIVAFLEEKLTKLGLNEREQTDFITFWGPQLAANSRSVVKFMINEECDAFATLNISPKPAHVNRVYLLWCSAETEMSLENLTEQVLPVLNRDGFDVLEWGGSEIRFMQIYEANTGQ